MSREDVLDGVRAMAPLSVGIAPFALIAGITAVDAGLSLVQAVGMSVVVFAGASQLAVIELLGQDAPLSVVVLTAVVINLRMMMYSASIAPYFRGVSGLQRWLGAYVLTDQAFALSVADFTNSGRGTDGRIGFYFGAAVGLWVIWQIGTVVGAVLGATVPEGLSLEFAVPLTFMALVFPAIEGRPSAAAAAVAATVAIVAAPLPFNLGLLTAAFSGIAVGVFVEHRAGEFPTVDGELGDDDSADDASGEPAEPGGDSP